MISENTSISYMFSYLALKINLKSYVQRGRGTKLVKSL